MTEKVINIEDLVQDDHNFNKGTEQGAKLIEKSFTDHGAGRSVLLDKDNRLIAGNKATKGALAAGIKKVRVIETTGDELIAVKRTDVSLDSKEGREMALADNATSQVNLDWDTTELQTVADQYGIDINEYKIEMPEVANPLDQKDKEPDNTKILTLVFTPEQYSFVLNELRKYGDDFTNSFLQILNINV